MEVTSCYDCAHFLANDKYTCQCVPLPTFSKFPTDEPNKRYLVPCSVTWRNPDGMDIHCTSFVPAFKDTLF